MVMLAVAGMSATGAAHATKWTTSASVDATETYNHYSGPGQPGDGAVTTLTGTLGFDGEGARAKLHGTLSATELLYAGQGQSNSFAPGASIFGEIEAVERFFFVDATANVTQTYVSPFGPQPGNITTPTANRYTSESYSVSPFIKGVLGSQVSYLVRDDNVWTTSQNYGDSTLKPPSSYWNNFDAEFNSVSSGPNGWSASYSRQYYDPGVGPGSYILQLLRAIESYRIDPQVDVSARVGYERDSFPADSAIGGTTEGAFYGAGLHWRPTDRTDLNGWWEHHYYGSAYYWTLSHRLPNVSLSASFSRGLTSYPQLALLIPAGVPVAQFLDAAFTTRIPDPAQRALAVQQFLAQSGLPPTLVSPLNVYAPTVTLQNSASASAVWVGGLNSLTLIVYRTESESVIQQSALPEPFTFGANTIQTGTGLGYSRRLSGVTNFVASLSYATTRPNGGDQPAANVRTTNYNATASLNTQFTPKTSGSVGVTYFLFDTENLDGRQSTLGIYASVSHSF
ncbi:MAG TPA: TIGR03016 family PEP-CTERM system-associated outer membrane protein [Casimicrobiaceae bacterium]|nr:TIGR03016 family PEP-CTERM system-associated outer membrane protein [Casimicrobiaceae bacterium]